VTVSILLPVQRIFSTALNTYCSLTYILSHPCNLLLPSCVEYTAYSGQKLLQEFWNILLYKFSSSHIIPINGIHHPTK
jgi:hypothetical protein